MLIAVLSLMGAGDEMQVVEFFNVEYTFLQFYERITFSTD